MKITPTTITTEADLLAVFQTITATYKPQFPELDSFYASTGYDLTKVMLGGWHGSRLVTAYGATFEEAAKDLREQVPNARTKAAQLRAEAEKLEREAAELEAQAQPDPLMATASLSTPPPSALENWQQNDEHHVR